MSDWTNKNRDHFNETASTYNSRFGKTILHIIAEIQERREWIDVDWISEDEDEEITESSTVTSSRTVRFLDYACGTGSVTRALAPYVTQCKGVDLSAAMVTEYNTVALNQGISDEEIQAVVGDFINPEEKAGDEFSGPEWWDFDVAAVGMGFHHFTDPALATARLAERLRIGGVLFIVDFLPHAPFGGDQVHGHGHTHAHRHHGHQKHDHGHGEKSADGDDSKIKNAAHTVTHFGFTEEDIKKYFKGAGVGKDFKYMILGKGIVFNNDQGEQRRRLFMARGTKA